MIKRLWQWFKNFWQRLFGRKQAVFPQDSESKVKIPKLSDAEYQQFFRQLLDKVNDESWSRGRVKAFLDGNNIVESDLVRWLRGFGEKLLARDGENRKLAQRMVRLSEVGFGELSQVAGEIGRKLLDKGGEGEEKGEADVWFDKGVEQFDAGDFEEAIASYDRAVEIKPDQHEAWLIRGVALVNLGRLEQAIESYDRAVEFKPDYHQAWYYRGNALDDLGRLDEAIASYDKAIEFKPHLHQAWYYRGNALDDLGRLDEAIASYDKAIEIKPDFHETWYCKGNALGDLGMLEQAIASYDKAIKIKPDFHEAWYCKGNALRDLGMLEQAIASYDKAIEFKPDYHQAWTNRGNPLADLGSLEQAIKSFDKAIEIKPDCYEAWCCKGNALADLGSLEQAIASFDKAIEFKPHLHQLWFNRGNALGELFRFEEAIASFDKAVEFKPDYYEAWENRGGALVNLGRLEQAIASYDKAIEFKPDKHGAWHNRGGALVNLGRLEQAIASYDKAIEFKPDKHGAWHNRGVVLLDLVRLEEAIKSFDKAIEFKPDYYEAWSNRGSTLYKLGRLEEAIVYFDKAIDIKPDDHLAWLNRGIAAGQSISFNQFLATPNRFTIQSPNLSQRGYEGKLASYREGLKYCQQNTHPEGWGILHQAIGNAHYVEGLGEANYREYWLKAESEYKQALITLTPKVFPELHLQVLKDLIRVLFGLKKDDEAKQYRRQALEVFSNLLNSSDKSSNQKRKLQAEFHGFSQMRVDVLIEDGDFIPALETAERDKNFFLTWILDNQKETILSPSYSEIQELVNPNTAIIYWHISPFALTTFMIQPGADKPIVIPTRKPDNLEAWIKNWDEQYENYRKGKKQQSSNPAWRDNLSQLLEKLSEILNISHITETIENSNSHIQNLILIPHRDLHRFPLHGLFSDNFTINYLPSAQIGLTLNSQSRNLQQNIINPNLLIVEYSGAGREDEGLERLTYAQIESETIAQIFENTNLKYISDNEADKNTIKQALAGYNIFHFSGHGSYDNKRPQNSAIYLSYDSTDTETNPDLTLPEIHNLDLKGYQLVSLSACETAITGNETVEAEYVGLVSAFLDRGVSYVVSSLWTVNEITTSLLMIYFYRQIKKGKSPKIALAAGKKWLRSLDYKKLERFYRFSFSKLSEGDSSRIILEAYLQSIENNQDKLFDHPYYWAGFIITGV